MSNWRISFGLGPMRYIRRLGASQQRKAGPEQKTTPLGCLITVVVTVGLIYLCCWGGVAWLNSQP